MSDQMVGAISIACVFVFLILAFFILNDVSVFSACLCFLGAEKALDYLYVRNKNE